MITCYLLWELFSTLAHKNHLWSIAKIQVLGVHPLLLNWSPNRSWKFYPTSVLNRSSERVELERFCLVFFSWWAFTDITGLWKYRQVRQPFGAREMRHEVPGLSVVPPPSRNIHSADSHGVNMLYYHYRTVCLSPSVDELPEDDQWLTLLYVRYLGP